MWTTIFGLVFKFAGSGIMTQIVQAWADHENVDLAKFQSAETSTGQLATAILQANSAYTVDKMQFDGMILNHVAFRFVLFLLLLFPALHFIAYIVDATLPLMFHYRAWGISDKYGEVEQDLLEFFVVAKPVDTIAAGAMRLTSQYLNKG